VEPVLGPDGVDDVTRDFADPLDEPADDDEVPFPEEEDDEVPFPDDDEEDDVVGTRLGPCGSKELGGGGGGGAGRSTLPLVRDSDPDELEEPLEPDELEPEDVGGGSVRLTARWAQAQEGAAKPTATTTPSANRVDLAMVLLLCMGARVTLPRAASATLLPHPKPRNCYVFAAGALRVSPHLALACGRH
jgi:hypothetical protein